MPRLHVVQQIEQEQLDWALPIVFAPKMGNQPDSVSDIQSWTMSVPKMLTRFVIKCMYWSTSRSLDMF